jgi:hypothetical protein
MMRDEDLPYYERRAREETEAAEKAENAEASAAHRMLATEYTARAESLRAIAGGRDRTARAV